MVENFGDAPWAYRLLDLLLVALIGFLVVRNLARLWRAAASEASTGTVVALTVVGALFLVLSLGPLLESDRWSTRPLGIATALIGAALLALGARDALRLRARRIPVQVQQQ